MVKKLNETITPEIYSPDVWVKFQNGANIRNLLALTFMDKINFLGLKLSHPKMNQSGPNKI